MNRKIMRLARGTMCGGAAVWGSAAAVARCAVNADHASQPNPQAADCKNVRRVLAAENEISGDGCFMTACILHDKSTGSRGIGAPIVQPAATGRVAQPTR